MYYYIVLLGIWLSTCSWNVHYFMNAHTWMHGQLFTANSNHCSPCHEWY